MVQARSRKVEAQSKLEQLQRDIAELSSLSPDTVATQKKRSPTSSKQVGHNALPPNMMHKVQSRHKAFCTAA